jgi:hypothetical protein
MKRRRSRRSIVLRFHTREWYERAGAELRLAEILAEMEVLQALVAEEQMTTEELLRRSMDAMQSQAKPRRHLTLVPKPKIGA